jgi:hypothetical protein
MAKQRLRLDIDFHIPLDSSEFAAAAAEMKAQMDPGRWAVMVLLAEQVLAANQVFDLAAEAS